MSKFKIFNVQLVPLDQEKEVGVSGYKKLFAQLRDLNQKFLRDKNHLEFHYHVNGDTYMGPLDFKPLPGFVTGHFVRYRNTEVVTDLATGRALYYAKAGKGGATNIKVAPFVFDAEKHYFAIDGVLGIRTEDFISALTQFLQPIAKEHFPRHELTINLISRRNDLETVFKNAVQYKTVKLHLNGPNGSDAVDILGDMRDNKIQTLELNASGGNGRMVGLPNFIKQILRSVIGHGYAVITYFEGDGHAEEGQLRRRTYDSREQPLTFTVRHSPGNPSEEDFLARTTHRLHELDINENGSEESEAEDADEDMT